MRVYFVKSSSARIVVGGHRKKFRLQSCKKNEALRSCMQYVQQKRPFFYASVIDIRAVQHFIFQCFVTDIKKSKIRNFLEKNPVVGLSIDWEWWIYFTLIVTFTLSNVYRMTQVLMTKNKAKRTTLLPMNMGGKCDCECAGAFEYNAIEWSVLSKNMKL